MALSTMLGLVRRLTVPNYADQDASQKVAMNPRGELLFSQGLPERAELVRQGFSFHAQIPLASAFTLLITIPTTLSGLALQNANTTGGKSYIIDRFWIKNTTTTASAGSITPLSQVVAPGTTLVADVAGVLRTNLSGAANVSTAQLVMASTATGCIGDKWNHHGSIAINPTTNLGTVVEVQCYGRYIIPPQGSFNISAQESVSGGAAICGVEWHEALV